MVKENIKPWLQFDNEEFENNQQEDSEHHDFLNIKVTNDAKGGDSEQTVITFDTGSYGGADMTVSADNAGVRVNTTESLFDTGKISITLWGAWEAQSFFAAMKNLIHCYELRQKLGE